MPRMAVAGDEGFLFQTKKPMRDSVRLAASPAASIVRTASFDKLCRSKTEERDAKPDTIQPDQAFLADDAERHPAHG